MMGDLTPPRDRGDVQSVPLRGALLVAAGSLAAAVTFYALLLFDGSLHGYDWQSHHYNYFDWVRISLSRYSTLPLFMNDAWITKNFLANAESPSLGPLVWLLAFMSTGAYLKLLIVLYTAAGIAGMFALLWDVRVIPVVAAPAAVSFAFGGFFVSHLSVGHPWAMGGLVLPALLFLYRRAALGSFGALWAASALNAFTILGGQHQPFIWQNATLSLFALAWAIRTRAWFPLTRWAWILLCSAGLGAVKLLPMLAEFADYDPTARVQGFPLALALSTLMARGQHPELAAPGIAFDHGNGWWEYAFYVGPLACAYLVAGVIASRRCAGLLAIGGFFFLLAVRWPPPLSWIDLWPLFEGLPVWRTQRGPSRFLFVALFCFSAVAAMGLQRLWDAWGGRRPGWAPLVGWGLTALLAGDLLVQSLPWQRAAVGAQLPSRDHRPVPLRISGTGGAVAELVEFAPNRLVYHVRAERESRVAFPFRLGAGTREWRVDGLLAFSERGKLAIDLPPGERDVVMTYRPEHFYLGAATSAATLLALGISITWRRHPRS